MKISGGPEITTEEGGENPSDSIIVPKGSRCQYWHAHEVGTKVAWVLRGTGCILEMRHEVVQIFVTAMCRLPVKHP